MVVGGGSGSVVVGSGRGAAVVGGGDGAAVVAGCCLFPKKTKVPVCLGGVAGTATGAGTITGATIGSGARSGTGAGATIGAGTTTGAGAGATTATAFGGAFSGKMKVAGLGSTKESGATPKNSGSSFSNGDAWIS